MVIRKQKTVTGHHGRKKSRALRLQSFVDSFDILAPMVEFLAAFGSRRIAFIGDIVHRAAEGVDREHRFALALRQQAHAEIERASGCAWLGSLRSEQFNHPLRCYAYSRRSAIFGASSLERKPPPINRAAAKIARRAISLFR